MRAFDGTRVVVFGLGGTIAMKSAAGGGVTPLVSAADLVAGVPGLADTGVAVEVVDFLRVPSASLNFTDLAELAAAIDAELAAGATGVVVTQGTDTIEESAYLLDLTYAGPQPIVVTGAMRNPTLAGPDGPANLLAAILTAAHPDARGLGVLVALHDEIHTSRRVRKTHATSAGTFASPNGGPLGYLVEGVPRLLNHPGPRLTVPRPPSGASPRVAIYTATLGDDGALIPKLGGEVDGLVVAAMGVGHVPEQLVDPLAELNARIPVVLATRTGAGSTLTGTYGFPGSERDLIERSLIPAGWLDPLKARLLLRTLLGSGTGRAEIAAAFAVAGGRLPHTRWPWA
ncbi:L-asparaginase [Allocatelliglobosispora scoriae]|uniref:L-asparaginase n=1 Tax=Allocatelliglobosispora scoriae TaxID=643052 RepID=A0A841BNN3_9ACTN|nr:asparaginase [Allocatelliglobosispora scoriae]MBB5868998.1 L-asparaginase [Allocatelliglobosispora scoriae]